MATDLHFHESPVSDASSALKIVFGAPLIGAGDTLGTIGISLADAPHLSATGVVREIEFGTVGVSLSDSPTVAVAGVLDNAVSRGPRSSTTVEWSGAATVNVDTSSSWAAPVRAPHLVAAPIVDAQHLSDTPVSAAWEESKRLPQSRQSGWSEAQRLSAVKVSAQFDEAVRIRKQRTSRWQEGTQVEGRQVRMPYQETIRTRRSLRAPHQKAVPKRQQVVSRIRDGKGVARDWIALWEEARHPLPGRSIIAPPIPPVDLCYTPPLGSNVPLVFSMRWDGSTELTFFCDNHSVTPGTIVVPVRKLYMVTNSASLTNVSTGDVIPTLSMSISLDVGSWSWSFSASVPAAAQSAIEPADDGTPTEVEAIINGVPYRFYVEGISRDRTFPKSTLSLTGRGKTAALDAPYAPVQSFTNTDDRTAQQLVGDVLTDNGVSMGWDVTWNPEDWLVPAGVFNFKGSYIAAINSIAAACGAYVQPHNTDLALSILLRYPTAPWDWATTTPDFELPSAVTQRESITWAENVRYNRVWVSGQQQGVLARVTRAGTAGDMLADTITDSLITTAAAGRQRALPVLAMAGRVATVGLRMPVLPETGIIPPGKLVRYVDGGVTRLGMSRAVSVDVGLPTIYQTISLETHV